jgi:hypothetical protein
MNTVVPKFSSQKPFGLLALMACGALALATTARAQVIAQDNFSEGTVGSQMLNAGAAGSGWAFSWADKNNLDRVQSGPLGYTDGLGNVLATSGNNLQSFGAASPGSSASEPERTLSTTIGADALANTADANTVWMSYLWQGNNTTSGSGSLFRQASILFLKGASGSSSSPGGTEYADIGMPNISTANDATVNPNISLWFANGLVPSAVPSTAPVQSTWAANTAQTYLILVEFTGTATAWSAANNAETMNVWIDPTLTGATPVGTPDMTYTGQDLSGINAIRISGGGFNATFGSLPGEETVGNVIFGDTAADVEPIVVPEPATLSLAALGGLGLLAFRRKR